MPYVSLNPATNQIIKTFSCWENQRLCETLALCHEDFLLWRETGFDKRAELMGRLSALLQHGRDKYAALITQEMGKPINEARAEVEKCALCCDYYAVHGARFLADEGVKTDAGASHISYRPLGTVLGIMPWNFPFWQVYRFAVPALMAGNACTLKHSSNVPQCALAIEELFRQAGFPQHLFVTLMIEANQVADAIASPHVHAVTLTGSEPAGRKVAADAGRHLKKCVLELGGSDPFIVLEDADLEFATNHAVASRFLNCGQSCIAAKRFILMPQIADRFIELFRQKVSALRIGDPNDTATQIGPMARPDLLEELHRQVSDSIAQGAHAVIGCAPAGRTGAYYLPSILDHVTEKTRAYHEEVFGPVAALIRATDEDDAIRIANHSRYGLGASIWTGDTARGEQLAKKIEAGSVFVNGMVKSDPRLPFGGVKSSGFGRELSYHGIREFVNTQAHWVR
ncbi:MAG: NAD-dependent succinate-semialdehyde dehydrogenase [Pseudomonadota bacterium]